MFSLFIALLSFSKSLGTESLFLNDVPFMVRPTLTHMNPVEHKCYPFLISLNKCTGRCNVLWRHGVMVITTAQFHSSKPELRLCACLNTAHDMLGIHDEDLWQWFRLEIRLNAFCRWTIPRKHFIIIIITISNNICPKGNKRHKCWSI